MAIELPLRAFHEKLRAHFHEQNGWNVVQTYRSDNAEHQIARQACGLFDLSSRILLEVKGKDAADWLHNLLTNDIKSLKPGQGTSAALLTPQAKSQAQVNLFALTDGFWLDGEPQLGATLPEQLSKFRVREKVEVIDRSKEFGFLALQGPASVTTLETWLGSQACPPEPLNHVTLRIQGQPILICRGSFTGDPGFYMISPIQILEHLWQQLLARGRPFHLTPCGMEALESLRIEAGIPRFGKDFDAETFFPEVGLKDAVSETKGCYIGQEFVVRVRDQGQLKRQLVQLAIDGTQPFPSGSKLTLEDKEIGSITSSAFVPSQNKIFALGYVQQALVEPGTKLSVSVKGAPAQATVTTPQVVTPEGPLPEEESHDHDHDHDH